MFKNQSSIQGECSDRKPVNKLQCYQMGQLSYIHLFCQQHALICIIRVWQQYGKKRKHYKELSKSRSKRSFSPAQITSCMRFQNETSPRARLETRVGNQTRYYRGPIHIKSICAKFRYLRVHLCERKKKIEQDYVIPAACLGHGESRKQCGYTRATR